MNISFRESLAIIFGAGASYGCGAHAPRINDQCHPPLAKDIFAPCFDNVLARYPRLRNRVAEVRVRLNRGENIEGILRGLYDSAERHGKYWTFQIPIYLRHLFWMFCMPGEEASTTYDILVRPVLESPIRKVMFLCLNYDLLLDSAIASYENRKFETMDSYIPEDKKWLLIKPHGSVNWAREIVNCPSDGAFGCRPFDLNEIPRFAPDAQLRLVLPSTPRPYDYYVPGCATDRYLYPQIVIPADKPKDFACPDSHNQLARAFVKNCANLLIIGFSGHDDDIVSILGAIPKRTRLMIVGMGKRDAEQTFRRICSRAPTLKHKELAPVFYNGGLSRFIESGKLEEYLIGPKTANRC
jgi:hypothetical protein